MRTDDGTIYPTLAIICMHGLTYFSNDTVNVIFPERFSSIKTPIRQLM